MSKRKIDFSQTQYRTESIVFDAERADNEARTIPASLSSDARITEWLGDVILEHSQEAIDLSRADNGLMMLFNHDRSLPIGRIRDLKIDGGKLRGMLHFSNNSTAREMFEDVRDGFLSETSISYQALDYRIENEGQADEVIRVTRWIPKEASIVTIPADTSVGVNRDDRSTQQGKNTMTKETDDNIKETSGGGNVVDFEQGYKAARNDGIEAGRREERERLDGIRSLFSLPAFKGPLYQDLQDKAIRDGWAVDQTREEVLKIAGSGNAPVNSPSAPDQPETSRAGYIEHGRTQNEKFSEIVTDALSVRCGLVNGDTDKERELIQRVNESGYRAYSLMELAREFLHNQSVNTKGMSRRELAGQVFMRSALISHGSDDFTGILANVATKAALVGWTEAEETWQIWTRKGDLPDFKSADRAGLGEFPDLDIVYENGEYKMASMGDRKESLQLATYGKLFTISRQAIINDDLSQFSTIPRKMGRAANRKIGDIVYNILSSNPTLGQDSNSLFDATNHNNYVADGSGAAPSKTTLDAGFQAMRTQTDNDGNVTALNITPEFIIGPAALEATIFDMVNNTYDPSGTAGSLVENRYKGRLTPVIDARIDADDAAKWYLAANPNLHDTVEVAFLDGISEPYLEQEGAFTQDGVKFKVRIDAVAAALGYQGLYHNDGN